MTDMTKLQCEILVTCRSVSYRLGGGIVPEIIAGRGYAY